MVPGIRSDQQKQRVDTVPVLLYRHAPRTEAGNGNDNLNFRVRQVNFEVSTVDLPNDIQ